MAREIGLSKLAVYELEDANAPRYGAVKEIPWVVSVDVAKTVAEYSVYADNVAEISSSQETGATLTIEVSSNMPPKLEAELTGKTYQKGALVSKTGDTKKAYMIVWEALLSDGTVRKYAYNNCTISKNEQANETVSDSVNAVTYTLTANAVPLPVQKELMMEMDQKEIEKYVQDAEPNHADVQRVFNDWFTTAPRPVA